MLASRKSNKAQKLEEIDLETSPIFSDTDSDGLYDWDEVNTEAIYTVKENLPENEGGDKELRKKPYLLMDDMPTINQCRTYYGKDFLYVESGFERFKDEHNADKMTVVELEEFLNSYHITPIWSCPVDADGDNDGVIDLYDKKRLDRYSVELNEKGEAEGKDTIFTVLDVFNNKSTKIMTDSHLYVFPKIGVSYDDLNLNASTSIQYHAVIFSQGQFWIKAKYEGKFGYILADCVGINPSESYLYSETTFEQLLEDYPAGSFWDKNSQGFDNEWNGWGCYGYALEFFYKL